MSNKVTIDGTEYYQPECQCPGNAHTCYLRPTPQTVNLPIEKVLEKLDNQRRKS